MLQENHSAEADQLAAGVDKLRVDDPKKAEPPASQGGEASETDPRKQLENKIRNLKKKVPPPPI